MTNTVKKRGIRLYTYSVGYHLEQGFVITVKANSARQAERIVRKRLDEETSDLKGSTRVHYADDIVSVAEVCS